MKRLDPTPAVAPPRVVLRRMRAHCKTQAELDLYTRAEGRRLAGDSARAERERRAWLGFVPDSPKLRERLAAVDAADLTPAGRIYPFNPAAYQDRLDHASLYGDDS
jgi:hypothetical protein